MKLKEYIKEVTRDVPDGETTLEVNLYGDGTVSGTETGNKIRFTIGKYSKMREICDVCVKRNEELQSLGRSVSTSSSMHSTFQGITLCQQCGKELK